MKKLVRFIRRLWAYLPVIWEDEDWDYGYLLKLIRFKIKRMRKHFEWCSNSPYSKQHRRMKIVELLIDRFNSGDYASYEHDQHRKKWGGVYWEEFKDGNMRMRHANCKTEKDIEQEEIEMGNLAVHAQYLENQDWHLIFNIIERHGQRWWD